MTASVAHQCASQRLVVAYAAVCGTSLALWAFAAAATFVVAALAAYACALPTTVHNVIAGVGAAAADCRLQLQQIAQIACVFFSLHTAAAAAADRSALIAYACHMRVRTNLCVCVCIGYLQRIAGRAIEINNHKAAQRANKASALFLLNRIADAHKTRAWKLKRERERNQKLLKDARCIV